MFVFLFYPEVDNKCWKEKESKTETLLRIASLLHACCQSFIDLFLVSQMSLHECLVVADNIYHVGDFFHPWFQVK